MLCDKTQICKKNELKSSESLIDLEYQHWYHFVCSTQQQMKKKILTALNLIRF